MPKKNVRNYLEVGSPAVFLEIGRPLRSLPGSLPNLILLSKMETTLADCLLSPAHLHYFCDKNNKNRRRRNNIGLRHNNDKANLRARRPQTREYINPDNNCHNAEDGRTERRLQGGQANREGVASSKEEDRRGKRSEWRKRKMKKRNGK